MFRVLGRAFAVGSPGLAAACASGDVGGRYRVGEDTWLSDCLLSPPPGPEETRAIIPVISSAYLLSWINEGTLYNFRWDNDDSRQRYALARRHIAAFHPARRQSEWDACHQRLISNDRVV